MLYQCSYKKITLHIGSFFNGKSLLTNKQDKRIVS